MRYRRLAQYRMRTLFAVVTLCCLFCLWPGHLVGRARKHAAAIQAVQHLGGSVYFDEMPPSLSQKCIQAILGSDHANAVVGVALYPNDELFRKQMLRTSLTGSVVTTDRPPFREEDLAILSNLYALKELNLARTHLTDRGLLEISKIRTLCYLNLFRTEISDDGLAKVGNLRSLETLNIAGTRISDEGLLKIGELTNLKALVLSGTDVSDRGVSSLLKLQQLKVLAVQNTGVTESGAKRIRSVLPDCDVWR